jgi:hypothetical protein
MKNYAMVAAALLTFAGIPVLGGPISFPECAPGGPTWFSLPGTIAASDITMVTAEPAPVILMGTALVAFCFLRRQSSVSWLIGAWLKARVTP